MDQEIHGEQSGAAIRESWEAERKRESSRFTDADLQHMVDRLFTENDPDRANFHGLLYAGSRPVPFLIKALDEPRTQTTVFFRKGFHLYGDSPFERICGLLHEAAPSEAAKPLARYLAHPDPKFRRQAAWVLGRIGTPDCLEPVKKALADTDREVRQYALIGLMHGLEAHQRNETFLRGVFPALVPLISTDAYSPRNPSEVLIAIDTAHAVPILESPQYFTVGNPRLNEILTALDSDHIKVPHALLLPVLGELEPLADKDKKREWDYAAALILYARNPDARAESRFRIRVDSQSSTLASIGAKGLEILAGINPHEVVWALYEHRGFAAMTVPQQYYHAVVDYAAEVNNGGHHQYFYNSTSDIYETAIEGLRTIGATSKVKILSDATRAFAPRRPAPGNAERRRQMELFGGPQDAKFAAADKSFYGSEERPGERLSVLLTLYALNHRSDFGPAPDALPR
jgi:hypothetical protein